MSFADPRDGDLEDDASSTSAHSLLRHASVMLIEISLPKLAIAVVLLIVVPALLLGAAPKFALWFAETVWRQVSDLGRVISVIAFAAILGAVLWKFGMRLFGTAERAFWSLNATLVQPLYTALREAIALLLEALTPDERLAVARRRAGLIAGGVVALLAALLAWRIGPLPTLLVEDFSPAGLARAARGAVANGIWAIAVYLMIGAPSWAVAEALAGTAEDLPPPAPGPVRWRVAHLSDIHIVGETFGFRLECGRDGPRGNGKLDDALRRVEAADAKARFDWVLITGDITDAGRNAEYIAFEEAMEAHPSLRDRVLILPGNHDVNIVDRANPARLELPIAPGGTLRRVRMLAAMARLQGARVRVMDRKRGRPGVTLEAFLAAEGRATILARFMDRGGWRDRVRARQIWDRAFPMLVPPPTPDGLGVLLLDSNAETHFSFTNALGLVGVEQLHAAEAAMKAWPEARWLIAMHHHLVEYPRPGAKLADRIGTALVNGHFVAGRLRREAARAVVLHGHRHYDWAGQCGGLRILSAPSPVMGEGYFWAQQFDAEAGLTLRPMTRL